VICPRGERLQVQHALNVNSWGLKEFLFCVLSIQALFSVLISLNWLGFQTPILTQLVGFCYLVFVPGMVLLRFLRIAKQTTTEALLFTVGLSLTLLMALGLLLNSLSALFAIGIVSLIPFSIAVSVVVLILCGILYMREKNKPLLPVTLQNDPFPVRTLIICLLPLLSILGVYTMNVYGQNLILLLTLLVLSVTPAVIFIKKIPSRLYPVLVFSISLSLLFYSSLISNNLTGWDINNEYYFASLVQSESYWNPALPFTYNSMLSVVMLAPIISEVCNLNLVWVFKIIYPILFSLVPVGLYELFKKKTNASIAFLSSFFFMASYVYYQEMTQIARQEIASIFLVLLLLLIVEKNWPTKIRNVLFFVFCASLVISHYGLSYFFLFALSLTWVILKLTESKKLQTLISRLVRRPALSKRANNLTVAKSDGNSLVAVWSILFFAVVTFTWYYLVSSSTPLFEFIDIVNHIFSSFLVQFINPDASQGLAILVTQQGLFFHLLNKGLFLLFQFFIVAGFFWAVLHERFTKFSREYLTFSFVCLVVALACVAVPYFSDALNASRLYLITLFFLAPFAILGFLVLLEKVSNLMKLKVTSKIGLMFLSALLALFLLFNSGFVYEVTQDNPTSMSLNNSLDYPRFSDAEVEAARWMAFQSSQYPFNVTVYADFYGRTILSEFTFWNLDTFWGDTERLPPHSFVFLRKENLNGTIMTAYVEYPDSEPFENSVFATSALTQSIQIYDDGDAQGYWLIP
jgi:uncharacterized membrane protein